MTWSVTEVECDEWVGRGTVGRNRLDWTVTGRTLGEPGGIGPSTPHMEWTGAVTQSRGEPFTFRQGTYITGGWMEGSTLRGALDGPRLACRYGPVLPALGLPTCTVTGEATVPEIVVLLPVYPGAELVFPQG